jgi:ABC-type transport system involved in multi-copper enzyme maturation permease subunit
VLGPIFAREFRTVPRRASHYNARAASLGLLLTLGVTAWLATGGLNQDATLGDTARFGLLTFQIFTFVQLTLVIFFAALSAASTVAQEKDRRTFILLLLTDLRDSEIVLGKLLGSLLPIALLLLGTLPVLALLLLMGGITPEQVFQSWLVIVASAFAAGSLGGLIALWRERTFQSLALAVLTLVLYFCVVELLGVVGLISDAYAESSSVARGLQSVDWAAVQTWLNPFRALLALLSVASEEVTITPVVGVIAAMVLWSVVLNAWGIYKLRVWNPGGEPVQQRESPEEEDQKDRAKAHAAPGTVRKVWANPVLWREIRTRAYGRRPLLVKFAYAVVLALICYAALSMALSGPRIGFVAGYGLVPVTILSLLLVAAQAVTAITAERDGGALDLLLVTDLTPKEFIFGKIGGVLYNTKEFLLPPLILAAVYAAYGLLATPPRNMPQELAARNAASLAAVWGALLVLLAFGLILGVHVALRVVNSRQSIIHTLGTVFFLSVGTLICIYLIVINGGTFQYQFVSFALFIVVGIGGLWWVLSTDRPTQALTLASIMLPIFMFYCVTNVLIAQPGSQESAPPLIPFLSIAVPFIFAILAMLVPMLSEFDVAFGRTRAQE